MNRQQRRKNGIKEKNPTYTYTKEQLDKILAEERTKAVNKALALMFVIPCEVLMDHFWSKSYRKKMPEFAGLLTDYYERWQDGKLDLDEMRKDLWEYGGVGFAEMEK